VETWGPIIAANILFRTLSLFLMVVLLHYLIRISGLNGKTVRHLREVVGAFVFLTAWVWLGWVEAIFDFLPWVDLRRELNPFSFIPHGILCVALVRLYLSLNPIERRRG
jgi:hypothetical protein